MLFTIRKIRNSQNIPSYGNGESVVFPDYVILISKIIFKYS